MVELKCKICGNQDKFLAVCVYKYIVNSKCEKIAPPEMDELPEYQCEKCGSTEIEITNRFKQGYRLEKGVFLSSLLKIFWIPVSTGMTYQETNV